MLIVGHVLIKNMCYICCLSWVCFTLIRSPQLTPSLPSCQYTNLMLCLRSSASNGKMTLSYLYSIERSFMYYKMCGMF